MSWGDIPSWAPSWAQSVLQAVQFKDPYTFFHCCRVGEAARRLGQAAGLNEFEQALLEYAGLFHDAGKIGIPEEILLKPGRLTPEEAQTMKSHAELSVKLVEPMSEVDFFKALIPGIRYHHERFDGMGYPHKLAQDEIPLHARIICIVDTVDAMSFTRPYRQSIPQDKILKELQEFSGSQFDDQLVNIYLQARKFWQKEEKATDQPSKLHEAAVVARILQAA